MILNSAEIIFLATNTSHQVLNHLIDWFGHEMVGQARGLDQSFQSRINLAGKRENQANVVVLVDANELGVGFSCVVFDVFLKP
eukprot:852091-Amphidinium_carterae.1